MEAGGNLKMTCVRETSIEGCFAKEEYLQETITGLVGPGPILEIYDYEIREAYIESFYEKHWLLNEVLARWRSYTRRGEERD
ncbi:hypothetical protein TNCT_468861 [Trichonephila clavata]|uniref:Uncharacterized protein n=1 Tax=Trichonephila clavata TaxID=2740835 RepID=A0A8X6JTJ3_TRICU|nr:hypothetical protein TNCT_468861 [Trichonephila clavata]